MNLPKFDVPGITMPSLGRGDNSFTRDLDARERQREVDDENLRRYEIAQSRLNAKDDLAAIELARQHGRQDIADTQAAAFHDSRMESIGQDSTIKANTIANIDTMNERDKTNFDLGVTGKKLQNEAGELKVAAAKKAAARLLVTNTQNDAMHDVGLNTAVNQNMVATNNANRIGLDNTYEDKNRKDTLEANKTAQTKADLILKDAQEEKIYKDMKNKEFENLGQLEGIIATETMDEITRQYNIVEESDMPADQKQIAFNQLGESLTNLEEDGNLNATQVTNVSQYGTRIAEELRKRGLRPPDVDSAVKSMTANAVAQNTQNSEILKTEIAKNKANYEIKVAQNEKNERPGQVNSFEIAFGKDGKGGLAQQIGTSYVSGFDGFVRTDNDDGFKTDKNGFLIPIGGIGGHGGVAGDDRVSAEQIGIVADALATNGIKVGTTSGGKSETIKPTHSQIKEALYNSVNPGTMFTAANIDIMKAQKLLHAKVNAQNGTLKEKKTHAELKKEYDKQDRIARNKFGPSSGGKALRDKLNIQDYIKEQNANLKKP